MRSASFKVILVSILIILKKLRNSDIITSELEIHKGSERGPFDIIGDIHGCEIELIELLSACGYQIQLEKLLSAHPAVQSPSQRKVIFLGDLVDRGPNSVGVMRLVLNMIRHNQALCVLGNHDVKFLRFLMGKNVQLTHGLALTAEQFAHVTTEFKQEVRQFLEQGVTHYILDEGRLVVAHAGLKEAYHGSTSGRAKSFALYGDTTGECDEMGLPVRQDWTQSYQGKAIVVYGHTPVAQPVWVNNTICIDTGCVFGGSLTALRYPEMELVSVKAKKAYYQRQQKNN